MNDNLIVRAQAGHQDAWHLLYEQTTPRLIPYFKLKTIADSSWTVDDLIGETWLLAAQKIHEFSGDEQNFAAWLFTIAKLVLQGINNKALRRKTYPADTTVALQNSAWEDEHWLPVKEMLMLITPPSREIVLLRDCLGFTAKETAELLDLKPGHVRVLHHRALKQLRKSMG